MSISIIQHTQGVQGYQFIRSEYGAKILTVYLSKKPGKFKCTDCRSWNVTATAVSQRTIKALPTGTHQTRIQVKMHRLRCHDCGSFKMEDIQFTSDKSSRISKCLERTIIDLRKHMSIKALSEYLGLHWNTVKDVEKKWLSKKYKRIYLKDVKAIGIDEVFMGKKTGEKGYLTIVRDLETGAVLYVGKGKKGETLDAFSRKIRRVKAVIQTVAVDLAPSFTAWIKDNFEHAIIVYDHFHVIKLMNDKLNNIRRRTMSELDESEKRALKNRRWHFMMNQENLTPKATEELKECKQLFSELSTAHFLKESLRNIYSLANSKSSADIAFKRWHGLAMESKIPEMITMANTVKRHIEGILAYWTTGGMTSASMEGFNNKIGWLTRQAYGYRDEEYLILKIYDLPNLKMAKVL